MAGTNLNAQQRKKRLRQLTLLDNPPPDPDLEGAAAPKDAVQPRAAPNVARPATQAALKKDRLKRNLRRSQIITSFQDSSADVRVGRQLTDPEERERRRRRA